MKSSFFSENGNICKYSFANFRQNSNGITISELRNESAGDHRNQFMMTTYDAIEQGKESNKRYFLKMIAWWR